MRPVRAVSDDSLRGSGGGAPGGLAVQETLPVPGRPAEGDAHVAVAHHAARAVETLISGGQRGQGDQTCEGRQGRHGG